MCVVTPKKTPRIPGEQKFWVVIHWFAVLQTVYLVEEAITGGAAATSILIVVIAALATIIVAVFATVLSRRRLSTPLFIKWTATGRVIAVAWSLIGVVLFVVPVLSVVLDFELGDVDWTGGLIGAVGSVSFLAAVGPGYSDLREALAHKDEPVAA
jgi:hypothetical protein